MRSCGSRKAGFPHFVRQHAVMNLAVGLPDARRRMPDALILLLL